jgi:transposase
VLVELKAVEQRYRAVIDVLGGMSVTDVARRNGVSRFQPAIGAIRGMSLHTDALQP